MPARSGIARFLGRQAADAALGVLATFSLFALAELALVACGVGADLPVHELSRGFDPTARYLVPDPRVAGGWRTQMANKAGSPEVSIPPKGAAPRVLLFGGSNTKSFKGAHLAKHAAQALGRPVEVVNLGRAGYGSERVSIVFAQALDVLDPDLVVVYSGHNEFVERGFLVDLQSAWGARWMRRVVDAAQHTRVVRVVGDLLREEDAERGKRPEAWEWEHQKFADLDYPSTLLAFEEYEQNLARMCDLATSRGVPVVLCTVVYNRFTRPSVSNLPADLDRESRARVEEHLARARAAYPDVFDALIPSSTNARLHPTDWGKGAQPLDADDWEQPIRQGLRTPLGTLRGRRIQFPRQWPWSKRVRPFYAALDELLAGPAEDDVEVREALRAAARELDEVLTLVPDHPDALYERALVAYYLGRRNDTVTQWFESAARYDRAPDKANMVSNAAVRRVAAAREGVRLYDADLFFAKGSPDELVGWEWMGDQCHLNVGGMLVLMEELGAFVAARLGGG